MSVVKVDGSGIMLECRCKDHRCDGVCRQLPIQVLLNIVIQFTFRNELHFQNMRMMLMPLQKRISQIVLLAFWCLPEMSVVEEQYR